MANLETNAKITPFLWFDNQAEAAMEFYLKVFKNSQAGDVSRYPDGMPGVGGQVMSATFTLEGQKFITLNAGPQFRFTEAISFFVSCDDQAEVDYYWNALIDGGEASKCGWLKDQFGLSWQIIPTRLGELLGDSDREKAGRAMTAMLSMNKLNIPSLESAFNGQ